MSIIIFSNKGGVGKTSISIALQMLDPGSQIITNDKANPYDIILDKSDYYLVPDGAEIPYQAESNIIYDFGGFADSRIIKLLQNQIRIMIPFNPDIVSFRTALKLSNEIKSINNKLDICFILNKAKKGDYDIFKDQLEKMNISNKLFELKDSRFFVNIFNKKQTMNEINNDKLLKHTYRPIIEQLETIRKGKK